LFPYFKMSAPSLSALSAYRQILRATRVAFRGWFRITLRYTCYSVEDEYSQIIPR
jgi:hypothetical protein